MKKKAVILILLAAVLAAALGVSGMLARKYTIGKNPTKDQIERVLVTSSGMSSDKIWSYRVYKENGKYFAHLEQLPGQTGGSDGEIYEITKSQWNGLMRKLEGCEYKKDKKSPVKVQDGTDRSIQIGWPKEPNRKYSLDVSAAQFAEISDYIYNCAAGTDPRSEDFLVAVEYGFSGDSLGSFASTRLCMEDGSWVIIRESAESHAHPTQTEKKPADPALMQSIRTLLKTYDWQSMSELPQSEVFALDAATSHLSFSFEPYSIWGIRSTQELTPEAGELWNRIEAMIDSDFEGTGEKNQMLVDYYEAPQAVVGSAWHTELVLYRCPDGSLIVKEYYAASEDAEESCGTYPVPASVWEECMAVLEKYKVQNWQDLKNCEVLDGKLYACRYLDADGRYSRVSSERMSSEGEKAFRELKQVLSAYLTERDGQ